MQKSLKAFYRNHTLVCDAINLKAGDNGVFVCQFGLQPTYLLISHTQKIDGFSTNAVMNLHREELKAIS